MTRDLWNIAEFSGDLSKYLAIIDKHNVSPLDTSKLHDLYGGLQRRTDYVIDVKEVRLSVDTKIAGTLPSDVSKLLITFSHKCKVDPSKDPAIHDPLEEYKFYFEITGYNDTKSFTNCWRLDRHPRQGDHKFVHPYYHFHAGGDELMNYDTGHLIMLTAPRLPHPPMDLFLGLHFLLNNFLSVKDYDSVKALFKDQEYKAIIKRAQQRMWKQYFDAYHVDDHHDFLFNTIFPLYIQ